MTRAYIMTTRYIDGTFFMFCLDQESNPITLCIVEHHTYLYAKSNKKEGAKPYEITGEKLAIEKALSDKGLATPKPIEIVKLYDAETYSSFATTHYKVHAKSYKELVRIKAVMSANNYTVAEYPTEENKLFSDLGMKPCQWIEFDETKTEPIDLRDYEIERDRKELAIKSSDIKPVSDETAPPRVLEMTFDCETYSARYGIDGSLSMPDPIIADDLLYCISVLFTWSDEDRPHRTICICVHDRDINTGNGGEEVISVPDQESLFKTFFDLIRMQDPDVIYGHNSSCYDFGYIAKRTVMSEVMGFGRIHPCELEVQLPGSDVLYSISLDIENTEQYKTRSWEGAGGIWHEYVIPNCYGRIILDTLIMLRKMKTSPGTPGELQSHSLKSLGEFLIGESKADMSYAETFFAYRSGETDQIARICSYCIQDSRLCMKIFHRTKCWISVRESASIFFQDANEVTITGQTQKSYTNFLRTAERLGFAYHPISHTRGEEFKLKGGHVEVPLKGKHTDVITLDFASMYPTAQRAYNICPSTYSKLPPRGCTPDEYEKLEIPVEVGAQELPAYFDEYEGLNGDDIDPTRIEDPEYVESVMKWNRFNLEYKNAFTDLLRRACGLPVVENLKTMIAHFVKKSKRPGILPTIQEELTESRAMYKKLMKEAVKRGDKVDEEMYDQRQQLVKVVMNSIYGCLGAAVGRMSFPQGAAAITFIGRSKIQEVRETLVREGFRIIYGDTDSLMFQMPRLVNGVKVFEKEIPLLSDPVNDDVVEKGKAIADSINETLPKPMMMEFEKVINAIFIDKKRYMGYVTWPKRATFVRGAAAVRGDTSPFARQLYTSILTMILEDRTREEVIGALEERLVELHEGRIPNSMLAVSKMLAHSYASPSAPMKVYANYLHSIGELAEPGTKIPLVVTKQTRPPTNIGADKKPLGRAYCYRLPTTEEPIDYDYYAEMARRPLDKLIEAAFM
jgi:DNA polymerase elongation subunit (family B)